MNNKLAELFNSLESLEEDRDLMPYHLYMKEKQFYISEIHKLYGLENYINILL